MTATLHTLPTQVPSHVRSAQDRIEAVRKVARDLYDARDEETNALRDLHTFEALFLSAFGAIQRKHTDMRNEARRTWGADSVAFEALHNLSRRSEADDLDAALAAYKAERERFYNFEVEEVSHIMAAE